MSDIEPHAIDALDLTAATNHMKMRVVKLGVDALTFAEDMMENGTDQMKMQVSRSVIPPLMKALQANEADDEMVQLRVDMAELRKEMMGRGTIDTTASTVAPQSDVDEDEPDLRIGKSIHPNATSNGTS